MTLFRIFKSIAFAAFWMALVWVGLRAIESMPFSHQGLLLPANPDVFAVLAWSWVGLSCWSGALLGVMHTRDGQDARARKNYLGTIEFLFWCWAAFAGANGLLASVAELPGSLAIVLTAFGVSAALLGMWTVTRHCLTGWPLEVQDPHIPPTSKC